MKKNKLVIKNAKEHNLKNINITIPRDEFVVITGLSGSGKSSLAFDTIYAEGQRRYVESLSSYARQFLGQLQKPDVESIEGLSPTISIDQKTTSRNPRSTVGTVTEIYDYMRLLFARIGKPFCPICGDPITSQSVDQIIEKVLDYENGDRIQIIAPIIRGRKGTYEKEFQKILKDGFIRVKVDGKVYDLSSDEIVLEKNIKHDIGIIVDRLVIKDNLRKRLADSVEIALKKSDGLVIIERNNTETVFSQKLSCIKCDVNINEISPRMFSFNTPYGACEECHGLGKLMEFDQDLLIPDQSKSISQGAIKMAGFASSDKSSYMYSYMKGLSIKYGVDLDCPFNKLKKAHRDVVLFGTKGEKIKIMYSDARSGTRYEGMHKYEGLINTVKRRYFETKSNNMKKYYESFMSANPCPKCLGARLKDEVLSIKIRDKNINDVTKLPIDESLEFIKNLNLTGSDKIIAEQIIKELNARLNFLVDVGLDYLSLERTASTLSGGEAQRIRLATQIGSGLVGVLYVLDEPSIGLHQKDNQKLIKSLKKMRDLGNTLIVVEHDQETIQSADYIIDIGPGAGVHGGEIVAKGKYSDFIKSKKSITAMYLNGLRKIDIPETRREGTGKFLKIIGAKENNLKNIDVEIPLGIMTCVTGVSGSGKSSLVNEIIYKELAHKLNRATLKSGKHLKIEGMYNLDKVIDINQSPIGRTPRSNPCTYTGMFDHVRDLFAMTKEARSRGYKKGRFSFNVKGGRCESCNGDGIIRIPMHFLPDVFVPCEVCKGKRYNRETLDVKYNGKNIADVLDMTVEVACEFFKKIPKIYNKANLLNEVGLGYIKLGQPSTTLSGGEAQRIKLASELSKRSTGKTLYILDEPTTGLHMEDVKKLLSILKRLVDNNNTIIIIEHNLDVIKTADYIIDLGPNGGKNGGKILGCGTPEEIAKIKKSFTGQFLKEIL